jgi:diguanylate cyclase (GGDEF)-like protein
MNKEAWLKDYIKEPELLSKVLIKISKNASVFEKAFDLGPVPFILFNKKLELIKLNKKAETLMGQVTGFELKNLIHSESIDLFAYFMNNFNNLESTKEVLLWFFLKEKKRYIKFIVSELNDTLYQGVLIDESFGNETMKNLKVMGFKDHLTGLYNRRYFHAEMTRLDVKRNYPMGLIMGDLNGLKLINDAFGHCLGDEMIQEVSQVLLSCCRKDDIVSRIGGDEFAVILPNTKKSELEGLLKRIKVEISERNVANIQISLAIGFSVKTSSEDHFNKFFKRAEDMMYKDKLLNASSQRGDIINGILSTLHEKHPRESSHSKNVSRYMVKFGEAMGFGADRLHKVESAGLLHDIGKIAIDYKLLEEKRKLLEEEQALVQTHSEVGYRILKNTVTFGDIAEIVLYHHERIDGRGYPRGLKGSLIPLESRMLNICDAYDAMVSNDSYRKPLSRKMAVEELLNHSAIQFDPLLLEIFIRKVIHYKTK